MRHQPRHPDTVIESRLDAADRDDKKPTDNRGSVEHMQPLLAPLDITAERAWLMQAVIAARTDPNHPDPLPPEQAAELLEALGLTTKFRHQGGIVPQLHWEHARRAEVAA